jgi:myo-inositol-1(or 4)-monophosphatase
VASGRYDGYLSWRRTHDWDIAGAAVILAEAGALLTDADGLPIALNRERPVHEGLLAGGAALHPLLLDATRAGRAGHVARRGVGA